MTEPDEQFRNTENLEEPLVTYENFVDLTLSVMNRNWLPAYEYTQPNPVRYPWMWLWDSCFHAIIYASIGDERALLEARAAFYWQTEDGMVPHMGYQADKEFGRTSWHSNGASTMTQPPMYGHALRVLDERGFDVAPLVEKATDGIGFLLRQRRLKSGLIGIVHPWESGMDDSPRWDPWCVNGTGSPQWPSLKDKLVNSLEVNSRGSAVGNPGFCVAPASFNALVAFNALELAAVTNDDALRSEALAITEVLDTHFDDELGTWSDTQRDGSVSSSIRTLDALLPALVSPSVDRVRRSLELVNDVVAFRSRYGPCGVDKREASFDPDVYWRGAAWPHLTYLLYVAANRSGNEEIRDSLAQSAIVAATRSDFAEHFNPMSGAGRGAKPQSWSCLPVVMF
ncbi:MAG TPA: hypothetical protein VND89_10450 [Acidimicrobiales bacterium]|nr:hypothetical protein [Acidimicrobiales bacterium]